MSEFKRRFMRMTKWERKYVSMKNCEWTLARLEWLCDSRP